MAFGLKALQEHESKVNSILTSTGDIGRPYTVIDTTFALDSSTENFFKSANPGKAFDGVKKQLKESCVSLGGDAVIFCQFEYRVALGGMFENKQTLEIFAYGTVVKFN